MTQIEYQIELIESRFAALSAQFARIGQEDRKTEHRFAELSAQIAAFRAQQANINQKTESQKTESQNTESQETVELTEELKTAKTVELTEELKTATTAKDSEQLARQETAKRQADRNRTPAEEEAGGGATCGRLRI